MAVPGINVGQPRALDLLCLPYGVQKYSSWIIILHLATKIKLIKFREYLLYSKFRTKISRDF